MADITRLSRFLNGVNRGVDLSTNTLVTASIKVGGATPSELTKVILDNLISLQNGSDVSASLHHHDGRYFTETELGSVTDGSSGASLIGTPTIRTKTEVESVLEAIDAALVIAESSLSTHLDGEASKHDASEIDVEAIDGANFTATDLESVVGELDDALELRSKKADLASTANGKGASLVGIEDTATQFTATNVEGALAEALDAAQAAQIDASQAISDASDAQTDIDNHKLQTTGAHAASAISFNNTVSGLAAVNVKEALDEISSSVASSTSGINMKDAVQVATTADVTLSGEQTIDGVLTAASRVLVKSQTDPIENGIYISAVGAWTRATDFDGDPNGEVKGGNLVYVQEGTTLANTQFVLQGNADNKVVDTDPLNWSMFSRAEAIVAGDGLNKTGLTLSVDASNLAGAGLEDDGSNNLRLAASVAGAGLSLASGVLALDFTEFDSDDVVEGTVNLFYTESRFNSSFAGKDSDDLTEGATNLFFTDSRAKTAAVVNSTVGSETDQAASVAAMKTFVSNQLSTQNEAAEIVFNNIPSGMTATSVQGAIDEVEARVDSLESAPAVDVSSMKEDLVAGETLTAGLKAVRFAKSGETAGRVYLADNDASSADNFHVVGLLVAAGEAAAASAAVTKAGKLTATAHGLTVGEPIWLDASGALTSTPPSAAGSAAVKVGVARDTNTIEVQIQVMGVA